MSQVEKNINALEIISNKIKSFDSMHDDIKEISLLINELEIIVRKEQSKHYEIFFSDLSLANKIISLCKTGIFNTSTIINSVSVIGNMIKRYGLPPENDFFYFFYDLKHIKKVNYYVSLFIMQFPQFNTQKDKWDYLISVPDISPKNKSERNFYIELKKIINSNEVIPDYYRNRFVIIIEKLIDNAKNDFYKTEYKELMLEITK